MQYAELILIDDKFSKTQWDSTSLAIAKAVTSLKPYTKPYSLLVTFEENIVRFYIESSYDIGSLSNAIPGIVLREQAEPPKSIDLPKERKPIRFLRMPPGGNILDVKEKFKIQEAKDLKYVRIDVQKIGGKLISKLTLIFAVGSQYYESKQQLALFPSHLLDIDFNINSSYSRTSPPAYVDLEKSMHILQTDPNDAVLQIDGFPYTTASYYLKMGAFEFDKHSFIVGSSGSGKSKFIEILIDGLAQNPVMRPNYRVVVIDPHDNLRTDLENIENSHIINFNKDTAQLFPDVSSDIQAATELTTTLFKSLLGDQFNPHLERVLRFSIFVLLTSQTMSLQYLKNFLIDLELRNQILSHVDGYIPPNIAQFFKTDFNEIRTKHYIEGIQPIVALVDEMQLNPSMVNETDRSLAQLIQTNFLTVFSLNKVSMGEKVVKTVAGLLIQQIFLLAQARVFNEKVILIIDEVSVIQNPAIAQILSEARKYGLFVVLAQQYFGQIEEDLRNAIIANVMNYYIFRVSDEDARLLEGNIKIELPNEVLARYVAKGIGEKNIRTKLMTELSPRECIVRVSAGGQLLPAFKAKTVDARTKSTHTKHSELVVSKEPKKAIPAKFVPGAAPTPKPTLDQPTTQEPLQTPIPLISSPTSPSKTVALEAEQQDNYNEASHSPEFGPKSMSFDAPEESSTEETVSVGDITLPADIGSTVVELYGLQASSRAPEAPPPTMNLQELLASQSSSQEGDI